MGQLGDRLQSVRGLGYKLLRADQSPGVALIAGKRGKGFALPAGPPSDRSAR